MKVVIRLQQAGYRNHPRWKIVVMPAQKNPRGRFLEHIGWWQPRQGVITQREITLNKERARYWIAMGAQPSQTCQKFLSYFDLAPKPLIKFGYKTLYEQPAPVVKDYIGLNPYKIIGFDTQLHKFVEQEEEAKFIRQEQMKNELVKQIGARKLHDSLDSEEIQTEIKKLQEELQLINAQVGQVDLARRQLVIKQINSLFPQMIKAEKYEAYKQQILQGKDKLKEKLGADKYLRRSLESAHTQERIQAYTKDMEEQIEVLKPISREEFKDFLLTKGFIEAMAEKTVRRYYTDYPVVQKIHAIEAATEVPDIEHENQLHIESLRANDPVIFPLPNSISPRPNLNSYDAADYYEIPHLFDPALQGNKAYSLPGITDKLNPVKNQYIINRPKNVNGGKKPRRDRVQNLPQMFKKHFSTVNSSATYMSHLQYLKYTGVVPQ